ncbi:MULTISPECIES: hypothetical protein [unclassified Pseudomonas]|uniref:hypothetical protein n=1 Tax=unclassified Pseudomonas TaxID=196821 RepID=UPI00111C20AA|nr:MULTISPECIES: hypothetical protein [unclassified Pseudomonas]MDI2143541.1 hypothetical protein [Pseudomonas sp. ITA]
MSTKAINMALIVVISLMGVGTLNWLMNESWLIATQASGEDAFLYLIIEILQAVAIHSVVVAFIPLLLAFFRKTLASYVVLLLMLSLYMLLITGINAVGPAIAGLMIAAVVYAVFTKSVNLIRYFRAK